MKKIKTIMCEVCGLSEEECDTQCGEFLDKEEQCPGYILRVAERRDAILAEPNQD